MECPATVVAKVQELLGKEVTFINDCRGEEVKQQIEEAPQGSVLLLENLRKYKEERANDETFGRELATYGEVFVQDAFGDVYGEYASVMWPPTVLPSAFGYRIKYEMANLDKLKDNPEKPFVVVIGGTKIKEKLGAVKALGKKADHILFGGGIANTIFAATGLDVKDSFIHKEEFDMAKEVMKLYPDKVVLPHDVLVAKHGEGKDYDETSTRIIKLDEIQDEESILDLGPSTTKKFIDICNNAKNVFWAGTLGYFEWKPAAKSSEDLAKALADTPTFVAIGGGETATIFHQTGLEDKVDFVSTGGGAALKYLSGEELPGLKALK